MPNNGRITLCPYYRDEKNLSISCEDVFRRFRWKKQKTRWMDTYCDDQWTECPYAQQLDQMYDKKEGQITVEKKRIVELEHENQELKKELRKTASMLGRSEKREKAKEADIKELRKKNRYLEEKYMEYAGKVRQYEAKEDRVMESLSMITSVYEARFAYLLTVFGDGTFNEHDFDQWCRGKEFAIVRDEKDPEARLFRAIVREESQEGEKDVLSDKE